MSSLLGYTVAVTSDPQRATAEAAALRAQGAQVRMLATTAASLSTDGAIVRKLERLIDTPPDLLVVVSGPAFRQTMRLAETAGLLDGVREALAGASIVAPHISAVGAVDDYGFGAQTQIGGVALERAWLRLGRRRSVGLVHSGVLPQPVRVCLEMCHAHVVEIAVSSAYTVAHAAALVDAATTGVLDAVTFASVDSVEGVVQHARRAGLFHELSRSFAGPVAAVCASGFAAHAFHDAGLGTPYVARKAQPRAIAAATAHVLAQRRATRAGLDLVAIAE